MGRVALPAVFVLLGVEGLWLMSAVADRASSTAQMVLTAAFLGWSAWATGGVRHGPARLSLSLSGDFAIALVAASLLVLAQQRLTLDLLWLLAVVSAAFSEEIVFRRWLPHALAQSLGKHGHRYPLAIGYLAAQVVFALAHFPRVNTSFTIHMLGGLALAGLALAMIAEGLGLGISAALHCAWNLSQSSGLAPAYQSVLSLSLVLLALSVVTRLGTPVTPGGLPKSWLSPAHCGDVATHNVARYY